MIKPTIVVSKCLGFEPCRYNGGMQNDEFVKKLHNYVDFIAVCPEVEIGLTTPRDPIRIVQKKGSICLVQPKTGIDVSKSMYEFSNEFLTSLSDVDGFILKSRSPSCGVKDVKIYPSEEKGGGSSKGKGFFAAVAQEKFPHLAIEDEGRLKDFKIREHFLTKIFILSEFRDINKRKSLKELVDFHSRNKLLFMAYSQKYLKILGNVLGNNDKKSKEEVFKLYEEGLQGLLARSPRYTSNINVLMKAMGFFSDKLSHNEKGFILDTIEKYRTGNVPFSVPLYVIKSNVVRFNEERLLDQSFFNPYPQELVEMRDSGKLVH
ncbi:uncharacterized protein YbgA (DUF1722 family)/uncharacterized protein YbbK (DUF523 family) [Clostridium punense]|uniref:Uncharacterized protein YbgA (DUF1722 family)/uncharacterized protein YbbK (DUF523 family) n=1 Tax=Clostridium punense TaxID=1054297 RepID=A0ABS4K433_9CLOT|nr:MULTISPECIES: DUF523 and DUF1722 domain-containing protein [Clostridium]EQB86627.1 hypothetical protein M918_13555 [Clostridium sp. BL8]MBP2022544.1 uncharacterized protein YbgA (DUF1722 family)/uncharacterized protein YbbK (DUF523 family) [Clostridium punense]